MIKHGDLFRLWQGVYSTSEPTLASKLAGLDALFGAPVIPCLDSAAQMWNFDVQQRNTVHIIDPLDRHRNDRRGLVVHQQPDAPLTKLGDRVITAPAWTAVEVARTLTRPRALATLDAALHSETCTAAGLADAADLQGGRRGIRMIRTLLPLADAGAESPMESEARLVMLDGGLPMPQLQFPVLDRWGMPKYFLDFAWPHAKVGAEYDSDMFHSGARAVRRDKSRISWLQDQGWLIVYITADDVRHWPRQLIARLNAHLTARSLTA